MRAHRDMEFKQWDLNDGNLVDKCGGVALDFVIISYVLIYCTNDRTADMLAKLLAVASPQRRSFCLNPSALRPLLVLNAILRRTVVFNRSTFRELSAQS